MARALAPLIVIGLVSRAWADGGGEVGAAAIGEGSESGDAAAFSAMRLAGAFRYGFGTADEIASGVDGQLVTGDAGTLRGTHWLRYRQDVAMRHAEETGKPPSFQSWVEVEHRFDYEERAALSHRRDLVRGRHTGEHAVMTAVMAGDEDPRDGGAFLPFSWDLDFVADPAGGSDVLNRVRISLGQWWDDTDGDGESHVREVLTIDSYLHDREKQGVADTIIIYAERGRPLRWPGWAADFRLGFATNTGETTLDGQKFVNERHPGVTASIDDGALRWHSGRLGTELRYDRALYLTMDTMLALEDRVSTRATWTAARLSLESSLFAARTRLWADRRTDGEKHVTDGVTLRALTNRAGLNASATVEVGRSFYADAEAVAIAPTAGWRATIDLTRRWGSIAQR